MGPRKRMILGSGVVMVSSQVQGHCAVDGGGDGAMVSIHGDGDGDGDGVVGVVGVGEQPATS